MENNHFITGEPNELVANASGTVTQWGKLGDWNNGYGKYTVAALLLYEGYDIYDMGLPNITFENWFASFFVYARHVLLFTIAFQIYKGSVQDNKNLLVINSKGILLQEEIFFWNDILSFRLSLEKEANKQYHAYYLHLETKNKMIRRFDISGYNTTFDKIHHALRKSRGTHEVNDLGFTQII